MRIDRPGAALLLTALLVAPVAMAADTAEKTALLEALEKSKYKFNPAVRAAYLKHAKAQTLAAVKAAGKELPPEFLAWVDKDPVIEATVYGARPNAAPVLMELCALWLDAGAKDAAKYKQLLLAAAVASDAEGPAADLTPRKPVLLEVPAPPATPLAKLEPAMTTSQSVLFHIRNDECKFDGSEDRLYREKKLQEQKTQAAKDRAEEIARKKEELKEKAKPGAKPADAGAKAPDKPPARKPVVFAGKRKWPLFDLANTPWPLLTPLIMNRLPLGEAEFIWQEFKTTGTVEFTEAVAFDPSPYGPGSWQDIRRSETADKVPLYLGRDIVMGIPSMMGKHYEYAANCHFSYGESRGKYILIPHGQMGPYMPQRAEGWAFGPAPDRGLRPEYWHGSMAYAMNRGLKEYLDSCMALDVFLLLPPEAQKQHGATLLASGLVTNPYNADLALAFGNLITTAEDVVDASNTFDNALTGAHGAGCPQDCSYVHAMRGGWIGRLSTLPVPTEKTVARKVLAFLKQRRHPDSTLRLRYQAVAEGAENVRDAVSALIDDHITSQRSPEKCRDLAEKIRSAAAAITDPEKRMEWVKEQRQVFVGKEDYFLPVTVGNPRSLAPSPGLPTLYPQVVVQKIMPDEAAMALAELDKEAPLPSVAVRQEKFLEQVAALLKKHLLSQRTPLSCQTMACQVEATAAQIESKEKRTAWLKGLSAQMQGRQAYLNPVQLKESQLFFADKIIDDETDKAILDALPGGGMQEPEPKRYAKPLEQAVFLFKRHVASRRSGGSCQHMAQLVPGLAAQIHDEKQKREWLKDLYRAIAGRENYTVLDTLNAPRYRDGSADVVAKLLGQATKPMAVPTPKK